jgi:Protein of unknown function with HXXEE motif
MAGDRLGRLPWLLPLTYLAHLAEEYYLGFPAWLDDVAGARLTPERFLELNAFFFGVMLLAVMAATAIRPARVLLVPLATIVVANGLLHLGGTIVTGRYSPGALTGVLLWLPLGFTLLTRLRREVPRVALALGVLVGLGLHGLVTVAALRTAG